MRMESAKIYKYAGFSSVIIWILLCCLYIFIFLFSNSLFMCIFLMVGPPASTAGIQAVLEAL
jgi:hypothetical protein